MATINIYHEENNRTYQVYVNLKSGLLYSDANGGGTGQQDYYLDISTNIPGADGSVQTEHYVVRKLDDVAPNAANNPAADFQELIVDYIKFFMGQGDLGQSSSSSSSSSQSSNSSSSESNSSSSSSSKSSSSSSSSQSQ